MAAFTLSTIYLYPIKSLVGIELQSASVFDRGIENDRRWMLVNEHGEYQSLKKVAELAKFQIRLKDDNMEISHPESLDSIKVPFEVNQGKELVVKIMDDHCKAIIGSNSFDDWFSELLDRETHLVYMPEETNRMVNPKYAINDEKISFANNYPLMMIGQAALDDLNSKLEVPAKMERFRPNLVFSGGSPFEEDTFLDFDIGECNFRAVKPCPRCVVINVEPGTGQKGLDPLKTLATYRSEGNDVNMGQNLLCLRGGIIEIGQELIINSCKNQDEI
ncbi:MOSC domain-containing protein [Bacteroidota bacterium]